MSFAINIGYNASPDNQLDKDVTNIVTMEGTLKDQTSVIDPVIMIDTTGTGATQSQIFAANYLTIPTFHRSYFITNITSIRNTVIEISAHVDVLSSYKDGIRALSGIIRRQENQWNLYLDDGVFKAYSNPNIVTKSFPSGFSGNSLVLAVAGS